MSHTCTIQVCVAVLTYVERVATPTASAIRVEQVERIDKSNESSVEAGTWRGGTHRVKLAHIFLIILNSKQLLL